MKTTVKASFREHLTDPAVTAQLGNTVSNGLKGSRILQIAGQVRELQASGKEVANLTIGDFDSSIFPIPDALAEGIGRALKDGKTAYPPAAGIPELREAIAGVYQDELGLDYGPESVQVGAGARPPIYAAFATLIEPGESVIYPVPSWNINYYIYLTSAKGLPVVTKPENGFMPTAEDIAPHLSTARMVVLNSPQNPAGTVIDPELLRELCVAIVEENRRRTADGRRPVVLLYDQVYWRLCFDGHAHVSPPGLVPEMAAYTVLIDAISKCWAATGVRVGWALAPPDLVRRMTPLLGHMGAWAARPEQTATAQLLANPSLLGSYMPEFKSALRSRLARLADGLRGLGSDGPPVRCLDPQGALYLSAHFDWMGRTIGGQRIENDEDLRTVLLQKAGAAVVPFSGFGYPDGTGWIRLSVGSVSEDAIDGMLQRIRALSKTA